MVEGVEVVEEVEVIEYESLRLIKIYKVEGG